MNTSQILHKFALVVNTVVPNDWRCAALAALPIHTGQVKLLVESNDTTQRRPASHLVNDAGIFTITLRAALRCDNDGKGMQTALFSGRDNFGCLTCARRNQVKGNSHFSAGLQVEVTMTDDQDAALATTSVRNKLITGAPTAISVAALPQWKPPTATSSLAALKVTALLRPQLDVEVIDKQRSFALRLTASGCFKPSHPWIFLGEMKVIFATIFTVHASAQELEGHL